MKIFRGKCGNTGHKELDWAFGSLVEAQSTGKCYICDLDHFNENTLLKDVLIEVDPVTVGQCTGLVDYKNVIIYGGDILDMYGCGRVVATFEDGMFGARTQGQGFGAFGKSLWGMGGEVIGNIHDNPELIRDGEK